MELHIWLAAAVVIGVGGIMQSAVGFGYALLATPLLIWLGIAAPPA